MKRLALCFCFYCGPAVLSLAQTPTGSIEGTVSDPSGAVLPGATVAVTEQQTGRTFDLAADSLGFYSVRNLLPGVYAVKLSAPGFATKEVTDIAVNAGAIVNVSLKLEIGGGGEIVQVEAQPFMIDTSRQTVDTVIDSKQIKELPLFSRNFLDLAILAPGVIVREGNAIDPTKTFAYRAVGIGGRSGTATRIQIDGIDVTDEMVGTTTANISTEALSQFQLTRSSLDISTSLTSSGAVNIISNSGSNNPHGTWFTDFYNQDMGARLQYQPDPTPFSRKRTGGSAGWRLIKDKAFWFANWEKTWQSTQSVVNVGFPFQAYSTVQRYPTRVQYLLGRLDWNVTPSARLFYKVQHDDNIAIGGGANLALSPYQNIDWTNVHTVAFDFAKSRATNSVRFGYTNFNNQINSQELNTKFLRVDGVPLRLIVGSLTYGPNTLAPQATYSDNTQISYDGNYVWSAHRFRYGGSFNHQKLGGFAAFANWLSVTGTYNLGTLTNLQNQGVDVTNPLNFPLSSFTTGSPFGFSNLMGCHNLDHGCHKNSRTAIYGGDSIKLPKNLTLNLGIRVEHDSGYFNNDRSVQRLPVLSTWGTGFSDFPNAPTLWNPSIGFAWDPAGNGKTAIRGGFYRAYEMNIFNNILFDEFVMLPPGLGPDTVSFNRVVTPDGAAVNIDGRHPTGNYSDLVGQPIANVLPLITQIHQTVRGAYLSQRFDSSKGTPALITLQQDRGGIVPGSGFKPPYSLQFNIGVQRELKPGTVLSVDYLYNHGVGLPFLIPDFERRHDASTLNVAAAQTAINNVLRGQTMDQYLAATPNANISTFALGGDDVFTGRTPNFQFMRFFQGGFTKYRALQVNLRGRFNQTRGLLTGASYTVSYSRGLAESTGGGNRPEFESGVTDNHIWNNPSTFGPVGLDYRHVVGGALALRVIGGLNLNSSWTLRTAAPSSLFVPNINNATSAADNGIFSTDLNGDGGTGAATPRNDPLPGVNVGQFGRGVGSLKELNRIIDAFNQNYAGKLTPAGSALVNAGLFSEAQLVRLQAVVPKIPGIPDGNPDPWHTLFTTDLRITRPVVIKEDWRLSPFADIINLFNHAPMATYTGLGGTFGTLNFNYAAAAPGQQLPDLRVRQGRLNGLRQVQVGVRLDF